MKRQLRADSAQVRLWCSQVCAVMQGGFPASRQQLSLLCAAEQLCVDLTAWDGTGPGTLRCALQCLPFRRFSKTTQLPDQHLLQIAALQIWPPGFKFEKKCVEGN